MPGTNAYYTFIEACPDGSDITVYDNCDAYPAGASEKLFDALTMGDVARATCPTIRSASRLNSMATEHTRGDFPDTLAQLMSAPDWKRGPATNFRYEVREQPDGTINVAAFRPDFTDLSDDFRLSPNENFPEWSEIFNGSMEEFKSWAADKDYLGDYTDE